MKRELIGGVPQKPGLLKENKKQTVRDKTYLIKLYIVTCIFKLFDFRTTILNKMLVKF